MNIRDTRQEQFAQGFVDKPGSGILYMAPRTGKCRVAIKIFDKLGAKKILIAYPDKKIKKSWTDEFEILGYNSDDITFTTHLSFKKHTEEKYDLIVIDEIHLLSEAQIEEVNKTNDMILGLTGTMSEWTERDLGKKLNLHVKGRYSIEQAIKDGVVTDYEIHVKLVALDNTIKNKYKNSTRTEKEQFKAYGAVIRKLEEERKDTFFLKLARMRIIQNSIAKLWETRKLLAKFKDERVLVFCGVTKIADGIGCPVFHSKKGEKDSFDKFASGEGNHMAVVKIGSTGVTFKPLDKVIINYFDSNAENLAQKINRCMAMEYDNPEKKAVIYIISSNEEVEIKWLKSALAFFSQDKITFNDQ